MTIRLSAHLDNVPRMTLSDEAKAVVTPEFAAEMNAWMLQFFGTRSLIIRDEVAGVTYMGHVAYEMYSRGGVTYEPQT